MKRTIATNTNSNLLNFLIEEFNVTSDFYQYFNNDKIVNNFDYFLEFDSNPGDYNFIEKRIGCPRISKIRQAYLLRKLFIKHPKTYGDLCLHTYSNREDYLYAFLPEINNDHILKINNGARGIGSTIIESSNQLYKIIEDAGEVDTQEKESIKSFIKKYKFGGKTNNIDELIITIDSINSGDFLIQEKVNLLSEFRVIGFWDEDPIIVERPLSPDSWQNNDSLTGKAKHLTKKELESKKYYNFHVEIKNIVNILLKHLETPFLSIDIYQAEDRSIGVLEFQMQMGYRNVPKRELVDKTIKSVNNLIKYKFDE